MDRDYRGERDSEDNVGTGTRSGGDAGSADELRRAARGQSAEIRRPPVSNKVVQKVRDRLSYGAFDWVVTEEEAMASLYDLARMPSSQRRSVLASLHREELLERMFDNLPAAAFKSQRKQVLSVYAMSPFSFLDARLEELLDTGLFDSVDEGEAREVLGLLATMPQRARDLFTYKDNGRWFRRLMDAIPPPPGQSKAQTKTNPKAGKKDDEDKPGFFAKTKAGVSAGVGLIGSGVVDLNDVETVMGGDLGGMQLAEGGEDDNQLKLNLDWKEGFLDAEIDTLLIDAMEVPTGDGGMVSTGRGTLTGVHAQIKWSTTANPDSEVRFELDELAINDIQILLDDITIVIGMIALQGLEVFSRKPPERTAPPTTKLGAIKLVAKQVEELMGVTLPGFASLGLVDPSNPATVISRLKENFGGDLQFAVSLDGAQIKDVTTSDGQKMDSLELTNLDFDLRQENRIQELDIELKDLELTLQESGGDLGAISSEDHERMAFIKSEINRLKPLDRERKRLAAKSRAGTLSARQRDRLRELDNELNQGVAKIELEKMTASGIVAKGHELAKGEIEGLSARVSGGSLNVHQETDREKLARELGLPSPVKTAQTETENSRAHIKVARVATEGYTGDDMSLASGEVTGIEARLRNADKPDELKAQLAVESASVRELQSAQGSVSSADIKGLKAAIDQRDKTVQATLGSAAVKDLQIGDNSVESASLSNLGAQITHYDDAETRTAKGSLGSAQASGIKTAQGSVDHASIRDLRAAAGPGLKSAQADLGGATVSGLKSDKGSLDSASIEGLHLEGENLLDANRRSGAASLDRADIKGLDAGGVKLDSGSLSNVTAAAGPGLNDASVGVGSASIKGLQSDKGSVDSATLTNLTAEGTNLQDASKRSASLNLERAQVAGLKSEDYDLASGDIRGISAHASADKSAGVSVDSAKVKGLRAKSTTVASGSLNAIKADLAAGGDSATASIGSAHVHGFKKGDLAIDEANVRGLRGAGTNLNDKDNRGLSGSADSASIKGLEKGDDLSLDSASLTGVSASMSRGERDAQLSARGAQIKGLAADKMAVGSAAISDLNVSATDIQDADKRAGAASLGSLEGTDVAWGDHDHGAGAKSLSGRGIGATLGGGRTDISVDSLDTKGAYWQQGDKRSVTTDTLGVKDVGVGIGSEGVDVGVGQLKGTGIEYADGKTKVSADDLDIQGTSVKVGDGSLSADVDKAHLGGAHLASEKGSADVQSLDLAGLGIQSGGGNLKANLDSLDVRNASGQQGDKSGSVAGLSLRGLGADIDMEAGTLTSAELEQLDVRDAQYRDGDKTRASVGHLGISDVSAKNVGTDKDGLHGQLDVGRIGAENAYVKSGDREASLKSVSVAGLSADASGGQAQVGLDSANLRDLRVKDGDKASLNLGAADLGSSQAAIGGLGEGGKPSLLGARTSGLQLHDLKADATPGKYASSGGGGNTASRSASSGSGGNEWSSAGGGGAGADKKPPEVFHADALRGMTGHVQAIFPVTSPISTKVTIDIPVVNGIVNLTDLEVDVTGLLAEIAIGDNPLEITKDGGLMLDITGPWNVTILEPGAANGLITKKQGGGKQGSILLEDLVEGLMNAKVEKTGAGAADNDTGSKKKKKKKKKKKDDKPPIELGKTEIHIGGLSAGDGRVGTDSAGITLDRDGDAGANTISVHGTLGDDLRVRADRLRGKDLDAGGVHVDDVDVDGLRIDIDKPLEDDRKVRLNVDRVGLGETTFGDQDALKDRPRR